MQEEKKFGIMLSMGISKIYIIGQFILELVIISVLAFMISYFVANYSAKNMANNILTNVTKEITTKGEKEAKSSNISGGAELDGYNKTLTKIDIKITKIFINSLKFELIKLITRTETLHF